MIVSGAFAWLSYRQAKKSKVYQQQSASADLKQAHAVAMQEARHNGRLHLESAGQRTLRVWNPGVDNFESAELFCTAMENSTVSLGSINPGEFKDVALSRRPNKGDYLRVEMHLEDDVSRMGIQHQYDVGAVGFTVDR